MRRQQQQRVGGLGLRPPLPSFPPPLPDPETDLRPLPAPPAPAVAWGPRRSARRGFLARRRAGAGAASHLRFVVRRPRLAAPRTQRRRPVAALCGRPLGRPARWLATSATSPGARPAPGTSPGGLATTNRPDAAAEDDEAVATDVGDDAAGDVAAEQMIVAPREGAAAAADDEARRLRPRPRRSTALPQREKARRWRRKEGGWPRLRRCAARPARVARGGTTMQGR